MTSNKNFADLNENLTVRCRDIYRSFGYSRYTMSKFEDYDLYAENRSFLVSNSVLTFSDRSGRLKALKPDVTLSIVKNLGERSLPVKLFYNENVYRPDESGREFREIMQLGLESIGANDLYSTAEVVMLAAMSLRQIGEDFILDLSHMGLLYPILDDCEIFGDERTALIEAVKSRSTDGIKEIFKSRPEATAVRELLCELVSVYAPLGKSLERLDELYCGKNTAVAELRGIYSVLESCGLSDSVYFDFSLINDLDYYNGIVFRGFVSGLPRAVLSGGRYDKLIARFGRDCGAVGFAIYLDRLNTPTADSGACDIDILLLYGENDDSASVARRVNSLSCGATVMAARTKPDGIRFGKIIEFGGGVNA